MKEKRRKTKAEKMAHVIVSHAVIQLYERLFFGGGVWNLMRVCMTEGPLWDRLLREIWEVET